ncbi:hypothetical protein [Christiangramia salexigens]|nr:hypothetical protein [Christiangramia salexigens]
MKKLQLPNSFKKIGALIFIAAFIAMFIVAFTANDPILKGVTKYGVLFGLLLVSISKEKIEDEFIVKLRMQSYAFAFIIGVLYALAMPFIDYMVDLIFQSDKAEIKEIGDFEILWMLLFIQVFYFHMLKRFLS